MRAAVRLHASVYLWSSVCQDISVRDRRRLAVLLPLLLHARGAILTRGPSGVVFKRSLLFQPAFAMPHYCVVDFCPSREGDGTALHRFPRDAGQRKAWTDFVRRGGRKDWMPGKYSLICSLHFADDCYTRSPTCQAKLGLTGRMQLKPGVLPTKYRTECTVAENGSYATVPKRSRLEACTDGDGTPDIRSDEPESAARAGLCASLCSGQHSHVVLTHG